MLRSEIHNDLDLHDSLASQISQEVNLEENLLGCLKANDLFTLNHIYWLTVRLSKNLSNSQHVRNCLVVHFF